jgi:prevent-host-death family protein
MKETIMTRLLRTLSLVVVASFIASGCLMKDVTETWYVDQGGAVTWVVLEKDVRSDANAVQDRLDEESTYWAAVQQGNHPMAAGLRELGATRPRTLLLRGETPYTVQTEGRFSGLDELGQRLIGSLGASGSSIVTRDGATWEWTMTARDPKASGTTVEPSPGIEDLTDHLDELRVVLISGRFESAEGFEISSDKRSATWTVEESQSSQDEENPTITLRLKWKGGLTDSSDNSYYSYVKQIKIADLKNNLSRHLARVRRGGEITVLDRDTPVARIVPFVHGEKTTRAGSDRSAGAERIADLARQGVLSPGDPQALAAWLEDHRPGRLPKGSPSAVDVLLQMRRESTR